MRSRAALLALALTSGLCGRAAGEDAAPPPRAVALRVVDAHGVPVGGARVVAAVGAPDGTWVFDDGATPLGTTGKDGTLESRPSAPTGDAPLVVAADGKAATPWPPETVSVVLAASVAAGGTVTWADGAAPGGLAVLAFPVDRPGVLAQRTRTDAHGRFVFRTLDAGLWHLQVRPAESAWLDLGRWRLPADVPPVVLAKGSDLRGRMMLTEGAGPAAGLTVRLRRADPLVALTSLEVPAPPTESAVQDFVAEAVCDAAGRLRFAGVPAGVYVATLLDRDVLWDGDEPRVEASGRGTRRMETWWVRRRGAVRGVVRDAKSRVPLAGANARVVPAADATAVVGGRVPQAGVSSDAGGRFRLAGIAPGTGYRVVVTLAGRGPVVAGPVDVAGGRDENLGDVLLWPAWRLDVQVVDPDGHSVPGARVAAAPVRRPSTDATDPLAVALVSEATTGGDGRARLEGLADGDAQVQVACAGYLTTTVVAPQGIPAGGPVLRVPLARSASLLGRVEATDGPIPPVKVRAVTRATGASTVTAPAPDGSFDFRDLPPTPTDVEVVPAAGPPDLVYARREGVLPGSGEAVVLPVPRGRRVAGLATGLAASGDVARVRLEGGRYDAERDERRATVATEVVLPAGVERSPFEFPSVPPGHYVLRLVQGARDSGVQPLDVGPGDVDGLALDLPRGGDIEGDVYDDRRHGAALGARVALVRLDGEAATPAPAGGWPATVVGEDGHFRFAAVGPGLWRVDVADHDTATTSTVVRLAEGETVFLPGLRLTPGGGIEGRITDARGEGVAGVAVRVLRLPDLEPMPPATTGEDGRFRAGPLAPGRYRLTVATGLAATAGLEAEAAVDEGETTHLDLSLAEQGSIEGVVRRRGTPVGGVDVEVARVDGRGADLLTRRTLTDAYGQYRWDGMPEGVYVLRLVDGAVRRGVAVRLALGDRVIRDLELGEGRISGRVVTAQGDPVRDAEVVAAQGGGAPAGDEAALGRVRTGPDGTFAVAGLPLGRYRLQVTPEGRTTRVLPDVAADLAGTEIPIEVTIGAGARVEVEVRDDRGRPVMAAEVWVESVGGEALHPRPFYTSPSGRAVADGLPDGPARVRVRARGYGRPRPVAVILREGAAALARVVVTPAGALRLTVTAGRDPVARARVDLFREPGDEPMERRQGLHRPEDTTGWGLTPGTGVVLLDDLEEGDYVAVVTAGRELETARVPAHVRAGSVTDVAVRLELRQR